MEKVLKKGRRYVIVNIIKKWNILKNFVAGNFIPLYKRSIREQRLYEGRGMYLWQNMGTGDVFTNKFTCNFIEDRLEGGILHKPSRYKEISKQVEG